MNTITLDKVIKDLELVRDQVKAMEINTPTIVFIDQPGSRKIVGPFATPREARDWALAFVKWMQADVDQIDIVTEFPDNKYSISTCNPETIEIIITEMLSPSEGNQSIMFEGF